MPYILFSHNWNLWKKALGLQHQTQNKREDNIVDINIKKIDNY